ncbi:MAG: hypothetical protein AB7T74_03030 [Clostridia bacterium]
MIKSKPKFDGLTGETLTAAKLADLDERLYHWELAQAKNWSWESDAKGQDLERKLDALTGAVSNLAGMVAGMDDAATDERRLKAAEHTLKNLSLRIEHLERARDVQSQLLQAALKACGYQGYDEDRGDWEAWFFHVTGHQPE